MNPQDFEYLTTEVIYGAIPATESSFTKDIYLDFQPDAIILKHAAFADAGTTSPLVLVCVRTNLVENRVVCSFPTASEGIITESFHSIFKNNGRRIAGTYTFKVENVDGTPYTTNKDVNLSLTFTFVKWMRK